MKPLSKNIFDIFNRFLLIVLAICMVYPFIYILLASVSSPGELSKQGLLLWPVGFQLGSYAAVFSNPDITTQYLNTIYYVSAGTFISLILTIMGAYVLSRRRFALKNIFMFMIVLTMFVSGGLIPFYLVVKNLGMINTRWALIIPGAISTWNLIMTRTYFLSSIPDSIEESAKIDGANDYTILFRIMIPIAMPIIAVMTLFYAIGQWNAWFHASIFLRDRSLFPVQLVLREILVLSSTQSSTMADTERLSDNIKYAAIIATTLPILFIYPFIQKYFVQGVMIGSIKE